MVTDRQVIVSNGNKSVLLTSHPFTVENFTGFDTLKVTNVTSQGFEQDGASLLNSYIQVRDITIRGQIKAETTSEMQKHRETLQNIFLPKKDLTITHYYGGVNRQINARVNESPVMEFTDVTIIQNYTVSLTALEPFWKDVRDSLVTMAETTGHFHFPLRIPVNEGVIFGLKSTSLIGVVYNRSAIKVPLTIVFKALGVVTNPQLLNVKTRECIRIVCEMAAGEEITITTGENKSITKSLNGITEDYLGHIDLNGGNATFLEANPGDNILRYSSDTGEDVLEVTIYFRNKYPGV